jgi:hypothetical protein
MGSSLFASAPQGPAVTDVFGAPLSQTEKMQLKKIWQSSLPLTEKRKLADLCRFNYSVIKLGLPSEGNRLLQLYPRNPERAQELLKNLLAEMRCEKQGLKRKCLAARVVQTARETQQYQERRNQMTPNERRLEDERLWQKNMEEVGLEDPDERRRLESLHEQNPNEAEGELDAYWINLAFKKKLF